MDSLTKNSIGNELRLLRAHLQEATKTAEKLKKLGCTLAYYDDDLSQLCMDGLPGCVQGFVTITERF
jgi:hypothetical protein